VELVPGSGEALAALVDQVRSGLSENTLDAIVEHARATIDGCRWAGITIEKDKRFTTLASTGGPVEAVDRAQYEARQGPCVDAVVDDDVYLVPDMRTETRWPAWTPVAVREGVLATLSVPMYTPERTVGGLNLYGDAPGAFTSDDVDEALELAHAAARLLAVSTELQHLRSALRNRRTIGAAQGILRHRYGLSLDEAHRILVRLSRDNNVKLSALAAEVVEANGVPVRFVSQDRGA
jgi:GAF domain-containing protein